MAAGASAEQEAARARQEASEYRRLAQQSLERARRYELAQRTEQSVGGRLTALRDLGWVVLEDRRWAGSRRANVDFLLVGPGGVVVVDVKAWRGVQLRNGSVFCEDTCRDDEVSKLSSLTDRVSDSVSLLGLTPAALHAVLVIAGCRVRERTQRVDIVGEVDVAQWVARLRPRLDEEQVSAVASVLGQDFPPYDQEPHAPVRVSRLRFVMPKRAAQAETLFDVHELTDSLLRTALEGPIESWMTWLHPDQVKLVSTSWSGPARIRGPAGTGKTVVGLHRAVYLAERSPGPILFVTFVKTLPKVLAGLCAQLAPRAAANVEFKGVHQLAFDVVEAAGGRVHVDARKVDTAFAGAWASTGRTSVLTSIDERWSYWKEEIDHVIKGRGLTDFDEYAELPRLGRRTPMRSEHREAMWRLYVDYERRLDLAEVHDFTDALIMARDFVRDGSVRLDYGAVIVDEAQDLNRVGFELVHAIAGDGRDRLLIIGDGQQSVYPGGFTLGEAGISVTGRAAVLSANYRNAAEVLEVAERVVAMDSYDDLEGAPSQGCRDVEVRRPGGVALTVRARGQRSLEAALVTQVQDAVARLGISLGDLAVLVHTRAQVAHYAGVLLKAEVPHIDLMDYDGRASDQVKVGTFKRAKGLEFKFVLLPGLRDGPVEPWNGESQESYRERTERLRRELYVGMTRARDGLWLGYLEAGG